MTVQIVENKEEFDEFIKNNENVMVYCGLTHCPPCRKIYPEFEKLTDKYKNIMFCKIIVDTLEDDCESHISDKLKLTKYPSFTLLNNQNILDSIVGPDLNKITQILECIGDDETVEF